MHNQRGNWTREIGDKLLRSLLPISALALIAAPTLAVPEVFSDLSLDEAKSRAHDSRKFLIIDFTTRFCVPCHKMDATTWNESKVRDWITKNAIAVQMDVVKSKDIFTAFKVTAVPCIVVISPADQTNEFDRHVGYESPQDLLKWLDNVKKGRSEFAQVKEQLTKVEGKGGEAEVEARRALARQLTYKGDYSDALEQYIWLWKNIPNEQPAMIGVRNSFMIPEMALVLRQLPSSRTAFEHLRDESLPADRGDWLTLSTLLGESDKILDWFDQSKTDPAQHSFIAQSERAIAPLLIAKNRWADLVIFYPDPQKTLNESMSKQQTKSIAGTDSPKSFVYDPFQREASIMYAAYLAAGRDSEADEIALRALQLENTAQMRQELVSSAVQADQLRPAQQIKWLDDEEIGDDPYLHMCRGRLYSKLSQYEKALKDLNVAVESQDRRCTFARKYRGATLVSLMKTDDGIADLNIAIQNFPKEAFSYFWRARAYIKLHNYEAAIVDLSKCIDADEKFENGEAFYYRAKAYDAMGKAENAAKDRSMAKTLGFNEEDTE